MKALGQEPDRGQAGGTQRAEELRQLQGLAGLAQVSCVLQLSGELRSVPSARLQWHLEVGVHWWRASNPTLKPLSLVLCPGDQQGPQVYGREG